MGELFQDKLKKQKSALDSLLQVLCLRLLFLYNAA